MSKPIHILILACGLPAMLSVLPAMLCAQSPRYRSVVHQPPVTLLLPSAAQPRVNFGAARLAAALEQAGYPVTTMAPQAPVAQTTKATATASSAPAIPAASTSPAGIRIFITDHPAPTPAPALAPAPVSAPDSASSAPGAPKESFSIHSAGNDFHIDGADGSGALYGCLELASRIRDSARLPASIAISDHPEMVLRGACIGMQKSTLLPGRGPYEYPYTPENFPWFYKKALWIKYLDSLLANRMNTLYLWNGHPFASLVRLPDYPYAVEVDDATFKKNEEIYRFLVTEADKRGIWVIQLFYNIIVSKPFAEKNHLKTQDRNRHIIPLIADYTRKSIAAFVEKYPNVGLMVTLGEAMEGVGQDDIDWFTKTIIPGIKDGLKALGRTDEPPLVLRAHDTDGPSVMQAALPLYHNLYVEAKYNGEALTTYTPHGSWAELHRKLSRISKGLIENVHIMANLEPFRYGSADFIQKCVLAMHDVYGASGLHLYPQASYWDWPFSADRSDPRLLEMDRDWIWYKEWARYAWNSRRDSAEERAYWSRQLAAKFGCDERHGKDILEAYEQAGEIAPKLLRRFGITDGNRQTLTLGMLMTQLIDPERFGVLNLLYESEGPPGESLGQFAAAEWQGHSHTGETPLRVCREVEEAGARAVEAIDRAVPAITQDRAEFARLRNDMRCYRALARYYSSKARAALLVLRYKYSSDVTDLEKALPFLRTSVASFRELNDLTGPAYRYANSMQTQQRKIPMRGVNGTYKTWQELLPVYQEELMNFIGHLDSLKAIHAGSAHAGSVDSAHRGHYEPVPFLPATVQVLDPAGYYTPDSGAMPFIDSSLRIKAAAPALKNLKAIRESALRQKTQGTVLRFTNAGPVDLLVGFFDQKRSLYLQPPQLETDASANDYGQADIRVANALIVEGMPPVHIHSWSFGPGTHELDLGKGLCLILGFVRPGDEKRSFDAGLEDPGKRDLDWLFEGPPISATSSPAPPISPISATSPIPPVSVSGPPSPASPLTLWYRQPAQKWTEALPIGNGRLGAMIFGGVEEERLQFNESTLWSGRPRKYARPDAVKYLAPIRQLLAEGRQAEAEALAEKHFMGLKDPDDSAYAVLRASWFARIRQDTGYAQPDFDDRNWKEMQVPTPDGWEAAGLQGIDGALWFRALFDLPQGFEGKDLVLDLGRIRDLDHTYINGVLVGADEGISKRRLYRVPASLLKPRHNSIAIHVINFDDKGGLTGAKGRDGLLVRMADNASWSFPLPSVWKYRIQDEDPPLLPKYEADYQPFGDFRIHCHGQDKVEDYRRDLDIGDAISTLSYAANGIHYTREYFASAPRQVLVAHFGADKAGALNMDADLSTPHRNFSVRRMDDHTLALFVQPHNGVLKGASLLHVQASHGRVTVSDSKIMIRGADEVVFYLAAATSFVNYENVSGDPAARCRSVIASLNGQTYSAIRAEHVREYRRYFDRFSVALGPSTSLVALGPSTSPVHTGPSNPPDLPTDERISWFSPEKDPGLIALYMQYARYLMISSSRPASPLPANLQGIWNDLLSPPWGSKFTTNINLEMNYWPSEMLNLSDCSQPLFRMMRNLAVAGSLTARSNYGAKGWVLHHNTDLWLGTAPINASNHGIWVTGGAWLCHHLWEHYLFTGDLGFLRQYYPVMRAAATFFVDYLVKDPRTGELISTPSNSPEHGGLVAGPTMDHQIIRDLFKNCISASALLSTDSAFRRTLEHKYRQIAPNRIGKYGQLQEWFEDKDDTTDTHRHISHLWGVYPGTDITWKDSAMMRAARQSLIYRGDEGTGWSLAWKVNCWARFREGDHALRLVDKLLSSAISSQGGEKGGVYPNLFDAHPPFQIDGNFGGAAGIAEMLVQSQSGVIDLLPALPAALPDGEVKGICARGGFELNLTWGHASLEQVVLIAHAGGECTLRYGSRSVHLVTRKGKRYTFNGQLQPI